MNLGGRIEVAVRRSGMKVPDLCRAAGVPIKSFAAVRQLMLRDSKRSEFTDALLKVIPDDVVNKDWVRTGHGSADDGLIQRSSSAVVTPTTAAVSGKGPKARAVPQITRAGQIEPADSLVDGSPIRTWEHQNELPPGVEVFVPQLHVIPPKVGGIGLDGIIKTELITNSVQAFRSDWFRDDQLSPVGLAWSTLDDDSMEPVIYNGECYVVDTADVAVIDGKTYSVCYEGGVRARKLFRLPNGGLRLYSINATRFPTLDLSAEDAKLVKIVGRAVHRAGKGGL